ncbi:hypothetical protein F5050DRAFT_1808660 [Lentinula boryana]|uniref:Uncharacterized protein n=1 Tax=Lentinula boryana TaxID=40481 RepID=A0ABQ8QAJ3_9AGAR|nr:hypothetical protein F5050DRAFT_1808660 [Lentinula boryana]
MLLHYLAFYLFPKDHSGSAEFRKFRRQLFHSSLEHILSSLRPHMTSPHITLCPDGHYRRVIYGLGPYIADYPEQALLTCIVQNWCPRCTAPPDNLDSNSGRRSHKHTDTLSEGCTLKELWDDYGIVADLRPFTASFPQADIHELISPDLLHQLIKGTFKDHLVEWVFEYLDLTYPKKESEERKADIDRCIATTTPYPGLQNFHEGRLTPDTSLPSRNSSPKLPHLIPLPRHSRRARRSVRSFATSHPYIFTSSHLRIFGLMKIFLPAIVGHVPLEMVRAIHDFLEFCYLARCDVIDEDTLAKMDSILKDFHRHREIFWTTGVRPDGFSLPRQHSMVHYRHLIQQFGAPNGLCSSITESKHIKAVKRPWRRSSKHNALGQMLLTNQRLDKLATYRANQPPPPPPLPSDDPDDAEEGPSDEPYSQGDVKLSKKAAPGVPRALPDLAKYINQPALPLLIRQFLYNQYNPDSPNLLKISVYFSTHLPAPHSLPQVTCQA